MFWKQIEWEKKTENAKESLEPVEIDKAGSEASEEGTHGLSKMFALLGYSKVGVYTLYTLVQEALSVHNTSVQSF